jgi:hypothetical protein
VFIFIAVYSIMYQYIALKVFTAKLIVQLLASAAISRLAVLVLIQPSMTKLLKEFSSPLS